VNEIDSKIGSVFRPLLKSKSWKKIGDIVVTVEQAHLLRIQ
ncbi:14868_t:CDS:1, partial [Rhizophagus irregularis]